MNTTQHFIPPAQLWIGEASTLTEQAEQFLQNHLCPQNGCNTCRNCLDIRARQHHSLVWIEPEKRYTLDILKPVTQTLSFSLEKNQKTFIVLQNADTLGSVCSNSLLKTIEEPPTGYHFILLTSRIDEILPTIRSRCSVHRFNNDVHSSAFQGLIQQFTHPDQKDLLTFYYSLEEATPSETQTKELIDIIFIHWKKKYTQTLSKQNPKQLTLAKNMLELLTDSMHHLPMPGSSKLFWKNLFLRSLRETHIS